MDRIEKVHRKRITRGSVESPSIRMRLRGQEYHENMVKLRTDSVLHILADAAGELR